MPSAFASAMTTPHLADNIGELPRGIADKICRRLAQQVNAKVIGDGVRDGTGIAVSLRSESIGLLKGAELGLIPLLSRQKAILAATLGQLGGKCTVAGLDGVDDLRDGDGLLECEAGKARLQGLDRAVDQIEVLAKHGRETLSRGTGCFTLRGDRIHEEFPTGVVVNLVGKETSTGTSAEAVTKAAEAAPTITEEKAEEESEDSAAPATKPVTKAAIVGEHPCGHTSAIVVGSVNYS